MQLSGVARTWVWVNQRGGGHRRARLVRHATTQERIDARGGQSRDVVLQGTAACRGQCMARTVAPHHGLADPQLVVEPLPHHTCMTYVHVFDVYCTRATTGCVWGVSKETFRGHVSHLLGHQRRMQCSGNGIIYDDIGFGYGAWSRSGQERARRVGGPHTRGIGQNPRSSTKG